MRRPSARMFPNKVTFHTLTSGPDTSGDTGKRTYSAGTVLDASVQVESASRRVVHGREEQVVVGQILFAAAPLDGSNAARSPGTCRQSDRFTWVDNSGLANVLFASGPAIDQAGRGQAWLVESEGRS